MEHKLTLKEQAGDMAIKVAFNAGLAVGMGALVLSLYAFTKYVKEIREE
jgi:hypothetical protein